MNTATELFRLLFFYKKEINECLFYRNKTPEGTGRTMKAV